MVASKIDKINPISVYKTSYACVLPTNYIKNLEILYLSMNNEDMIAFFLSNNVKLYYNSNYFMFLKYTEI